MDRSVRTVKTSKTVDGVDRVYLPGEIEWENYEPWSDHGIPLHKDHLSALAETADKLGVDVFWEVGEE